jgi:hypothetical protein
MSARLIDVAVLKIPASRPLKPYEAAVIRGYFGQIFPNESLLHHHFNEKLLYTYPRIQFKVIEAQAHIIGIEEGVSILTNIRSEINKFRIGLENIEFHNPEFKVKTERFGDTEYEKEYTFTTIWLALNEQNYHRYISSPPPQKEDILRRAIIGNILSMCKGLGYVVKGQLSVRLNGKEAPATLKGTSMLGFL